MIDITKVQYRLVVMDESGTQYNVTDYVENLGWEEAERELATRITFDARNAECKEGILSAVARLGCLVGIFCTDGIRDDEVARGYIVDWITKTASDDEELQCKCYDSVYNLQESQDNIFYSDGIGTEEAILTIFDNWEILFGDYKGPHVTHGKLVFKSEALSDVLLKILEDAYRKGANKCIIRSEKGRVSILPYGENKEIYHFSVENTKSVTNKRSTAGMVTRVKIIGQADDEGKSSVEAVMDGQTRFGVRQKIQIRGTDESLQDAQNAAQAVLDEEGKLREEITVVGPDIPWIRRGDVVHVEAGTVEGYYYVMGIQHDADAGQMTMNLHVPWEEREEQLGSVEQRNYNVGDIVNFHGGTHFVSSYPESVGYPVSAGRAKITIKDGAGGAHPWHLVTENYAETTVYGWVDNNTFD